MCCFLSMRYPKTAPMAKSKASYMISNGFDQSDAEIIGVEISSFLCFSQTLGHPRSKVKGMFLAKRLIKGLEILPKSL